jgi:hypothetical protein
MWRGLALGILLLMSGHRLAAQEPWSVGMRGQYGFIWPHRPSNWVQVEGHTWSAEIFADRALSGMAAWHHDYPGLRYGIGVQYTDMANPQLIGTTVRVLPHAYVPFVQGGHGALGLRGGWGLGWVEKPFDRRDNAKQIALGSHLNLAIHLMLEYRHTWGRHALGAGISLDHLSNGSYRQPNLGVNLLNVNLAYSYALGTAPPIVGVADTTAMALNKGREQLVVGSFAISETEQPHTGQYTVYSLSGHVRWRRTRKSSFGAGVDLFNKGALRTLDTGLGDGGRAALTQAGLHGGWTLHFGQGEFLFQMGAYVHTPVPDAAAVYHRIGLRLRSGRHLLWNLSLKSHYAVADHLEFGVGYAWR